VKPLVATLLVLLAGCSGAAPTARDVLPAAFERIATVDLRSPQAADWDGRELLYVADASAREVVVLTLGGAFVRRISGSADAPLAAPVDLVTFGGLTVSVADRGLEAVARFGADGRALGLLRPAGRTQATGLDETLPLGAREPFVPVALTAAPDGTLYVATEEGGLYQISPDLRLTPLRRADTADALPGVRALAATDDAVWMVRGGRLVRFDRLLVRGIAQPDLIGVQAIAVRAGRLAVVTDSGVWLWSEGASRLVIDGPIAGVRDAVWAGRSLVVVTAAGLWRADL
jgi:hypothetical protein